MSPLAERLSFKLPLILFLVIVGAYLPALWNGFVWDDLTVIVGSDRLWQWSALLEWITILPADGQLDAFDLLTFFAAAADADLVTSRYRNRHYPLGRQTLSLGLRALTALIVGAYVPSEGAYLIRREVLHELNPRSRSFLLNLEIPIRARRGGFRIETVTTSVHDRSAGESKAATPRRILNTFLDHFSLRVMLERERIETKVRGFLRPPR